MSTFVGRERELARLHAGLEDALAGRGRLFLVSGEPGIGKSRLADELTQTARDRGAGILVGRCWEAGGAPAYWPWVQAIRARVRERDLETLRTELGAGAPYLAQIVPELRELLPWLPEPPALETEGARFQLFDAVASFLRRTADPQALVLALDDVHAADEPSLLLLRFLARELSASRLLLLAVYRDVDPTLADPLATALTELSREPSTEPLRLTGLGEADVARFIEVTTGRVPAARVAAAVHEESEGNPLFAGEIVRLLAAEGMLEQAGDRLAIPLSVKEVIGRRLRHLSDECNRVLTLASVLGREFDFDVVARVSGLDASALLGLLDEAMAARVISELPGAVGRLRFAHQLIRDTLYESLPASRRLQLHLEVGEALEALHAADVDPHLAELALHFFEAAPVAGAERAIDYARRAGDRAARLLAYEEAVRLYELALKLVEDDVERCELLLATGDAQARAGDPPAFMATYQKAAELAERLELPEQLARAALGYGGRLSWEVSRDAEYLKALLERALAALSDDDSVLRVRLLARLAGGPLRDASFPLERRRPLSQEALDMARRIGDPATLAYALAGYMNSHHSPTFTPDQVQVGGELAEVATEAGDLERATEGHEGRMLALLELGDVHEAKVELETMRGLADQLRQPSQRWVVAVYDAMLALLEGRLDEAEDLIFHARSLGERSQRWSAVVSFGLQLYVLRWEQGRLSEMDELVRASVQEHPTYPVWRCVLAHLEAELGRKDQARQLLEPDLPFDEEWLVGMGFLSEAAHSLDDAAGAARLYEQLLPYADRVAISYPEISTGSVARYLGLLASTAGRWEDAERHFEDALATHERIGARSWLARTQANYAAMLLERRGPGDEEKAAELLAVAMASARELGMALTPPPSAEEVEVFAGYRIEGELARGGMGVVHRATDVRLERPVALKVIAPELAEDSSFRERFLTESRLAASLDHPNVVPIYEAGAEDGQLFIAMRYVDGTDLKALLAAETRLTVERALSICGQVGAALDTAHAKGLVHRDVKPANVLLDEREHAYLADFGLTKQATGASTQTGRLLGTLDYIAPEQIRGDELDGRSDEYALACVLHECLTGAAPFRRPTEAETLWAHMQERPPALPGYPELGPVLARALAKDKEERYATCGDFIDAAREALGFETPRVRRRKRLIRRSRALLAAGALVLAGGIAALVVELTTGAEAGLASVQPNSVIQIDPKENRAVAQFAVGGTPTTIAAGEGFVWALNADDQTISRIDPSSKVAKTFGSGTTPITLVTGASALWVGNGATSSTSQFVGPSLVSVSRVDPGTLNVEGTSQIPAPGAPTGAPPALLVANGTLWAVDGRQNVVRIDPRRGAVVAIVRGAHAIALAAERRGAVWVLRDDNAVASIDPLTNRLGPPIRIPGRSVNDIAVGAGSVWVSDTDDGTVWRIDPGPPLAERTIAVARGADQLAFGQGSVWVVNPRQGTVSRIDPAANLVSRTIDVGGTPRDVAVDQGGAWVSDAGAQCGSVVYRGTGKPDFLVVSDFALRLGPLSPGTAMTQAIELALERRRFRAGKYRVAYQSCDDSTSQVGFFDVSKCAANAKAYAANEDVIGVIGTFNSPCAAEEIPFANTAPRGPLAMISPSNSYDGLTRSYPRAPKGELAHLYPIGKRNYVRIYPRDAAQAAADAVFVKSLGAHMVYVLHDREAYGDILASSFTRAARRLGLGVAGDATWDAGAASYAALANRVARSGADAVFLSGLLQTGGGRVLKDLRSRLGARVRIVAPDGFIPTGPLFQDAGASAARSIYISSFGLTNDRLPPAGRRFLAAFKSRHHVSVVSPFAVYAAQAADVLLDAIARSDGTRASVTKELFAIRVHNGLLGSFGFDRNGDITTPQATIFRPVRSGGTNAIQSVAGTEVVRVITVPQRLLR